MRSSSMLQFDESLVIGSDTLTGVNDEDYKPPFPLTAKLNKLTIKVDRPKLTPEDIKKLDVRKQRHWTARRFVMGSPGRDKLEAVQQSNKASE